MTIREFITKEIDIDVCDDYDESCYIAFVGAQKLTEEGKEHFKAVLDKEITIYDDIALFEVEDEEDLALCKKFFYGCAGYIGVKEYEKYFGEL